MTPTQRAAMEQAMEVLIAVSGHVCQAAHHAKRDQHSSGATCPVETRHDAAVEALRAALAEQPAEQPAEQVACSICDGSSFITHDDGPRREKNGGKWGRCLHCQPYTAPQPAKREPVAWMPIEQMYPQAKAIDILMGDGSILCAVLPQFDGDLWWEGSGTGEKFIDPKYANVTHWRIHDERTPQPAKSAEQEPVAQRWQPIETAPKGRIVLVYYKNSLGNGRTMRARYYLPETLDSDTTESGWADEGWYEESEAYEYLMPLEHDPTHWMPLPAGPDTAPQPAKRVQLTDDEIDVLWAKQQTKPFKTHAEDRRAFARAVIAAYDAKNGITGETK